MMADQSRRFWKVSDFWIRLIINTCLFATISGLSAIWFYQNEERHMYQLISDTRAETVAVTTERDVLQSQLNEVNAIVVNRDSQIQQLVTELTKFKKPINAPRDCFKLGDTKELIIQNLGSPDTLEWDLYKDSKNIGYSTAHYGNAQILIDDKSGVTRYWNIGNKLCR